MLRSSLLWSPSLRSLTSLNRFCTKSTLNVEKIEAEQGSEEVVLVEDPEDVEARQAHLKRIRNKSGLLPQDYRLLHGEKPYDEAQSWVHTTLRYQRTMFGRYGLKSGVDPRICYPTRAERFDKAEWERVAYPNTLKQMVEISQREAQEKADVIQKRQENIEKKLEKLDVWISDLNSRIAKKEAQARAAKEKKERMVEEVRRQFGLALDPRDEKFQELLAQKEKEEKKKEKEARRREKELQMLEKLVAKGKASEAAGAEAKAASSDTKTPPESGNKAT